MSEPGPSPLHAGADDELGVAQVRALIAGALQPVTERQRLPLAQALDRVLASPVVAPIDVPAHDNAAMDGYAFAGRDLAPAGQPTVLRLAGRVQAGAPYGAAVAAGSCVRIMTGAVMPTGLDTVAPQELCRVLDGQVHVAADTVAAGAHRRHRGEDLRAGAPALPAGRRLTPADLGLLASLGVEQVDVLRRLRVALFSTGNELRQPGQALVPGSIYDSNRASLRAALQRLGADVLDLGPVADDPAALEAALRDAAAQADAVLTSGGVSVGDADHTRAVLARLGTVTFWKVAMRPGRPLAFGHLRRADGGSAALFALPGNPVAALVAFHVFARDALLQLAGALPQPLPLLQVRSAEAIRKRPGRTEFQRAIVSTAPDGVAELRLTGPQGAGVLRSMSLANALVVLAADRGSVAAGDSVPVWLFDGLG